MIRPDRVVGPMAVLAVLCVLATGCSEPSRVGGFELADAMVAVRVEGASTAVVGRHELASGTSFDLFAVLRARRGDETVYFTEADALVLGGSPVPPAQVRPWPESRRARVRWFTIEGTPPYSEWSERQRFPAYHPVFRPEWGAGWSVPGDLRPRNSNLASGADAFGPRAFGTARFHVRVEIYAPGSDLTPVARYASPGVDADGGEIDPQATRVTLHLAPPLDVASRVFGLPQVEVLPDDPRLREQFSTMADAGMLFSRTWVVRGALVEAGLEWDRLTWRPLDLSATEAERSAWGEDLAPGDLLRAGSRVVFAFRDTQQGAAPDAQVVPGVVDYSDLCLDFSRGAAVRALNEVFTGGGEVDVASLSPGSSG